MNGGAAVEPFSAKPERREEREAENDMDVDKHAPVTTTTTTSTDSRPESINKEHAAPMAVATPQDQQPREQAAPVAAKEKPPKQEEAVPAPGKVKESAGPALDEVEAGVRLLRGHEAEVCFGV